jgi:hypothetical protein
MESEVPGGVAIQHPLEYHEQLFAITTWRYLRLAMVVLLLGLGVSIAYEHWQVLGGCVQPSISAYYYTPARGYFAGALISIGVCLFCLKGNTEREDVLLNLAGMLAPFVALVPTPDQGSCATLLVKTHDRDVSVANNVRALLAVELIALVLLAVSARRAHERASRTSRVGYGVAVVVLVAAGLVFYLDRHAFVQGAHTTAASLMFACIVAVACSNALGYRQRPDAPWRRNPYWTIAGAMLASLIVVFPIKWTTHWDHWLLVLEGLLIGLFALFWGIQTKELWREGLR